MTETKTNQTTPDQMMKAFEGKSLKSIILFTIIVHAVLLIGTSVPYLWGAVAGEDTTGQSEEERLDKATKEATNALREIAERYQVKPQDLSNSFTGGASKVPAATSATTTDQPASEEPAAGESEEPGSIIEQEIQKVEDGPELPPIEDEDLFK